MVHVFVGKCTYITVVDEVGTSQCGCGASVVQHYSTLISTIP